jgi:hypothetical protein
MIRTTRNKITTFPEDSAPSDFIVVAGRWSGDPGLKK